MAMRNLHSRWQSQKQGDVIVFHGATPPWRDKIGELVDRICHLDYEIFIQTPIGIVPFSLEDLNPWAHVEGTSWMWNSQADHIKIQSDLKNSA